MLRRLFAAAVVASCLLGPASPALASGADVIRDCNDNGRLTKEYSQKEYREALSEMPADVRQYTDCENIIRRAQLRIPDSTAGPDANAGNPFGTAASPEEVAEAREDIAEAVKGGGRRESAGGAKRQRKSRRGDTGIPFVTPSPVSYTKVTAATSAMPAPLLVLVVLIVLAIVGAAYLIVQSRRREHRGDPGA